MKSIRTQAAEMGREVVGKLRGTKDDVFEADGVEVRTKIYLDDEGVEYAASQLGGVAYIAGEDWVI